MPPAGKPRSTTPPVAIWKGPTPTSLSMASQACCGCPRFRPAKRAGVPLSATFQEPGVHHVAFQLAADALHGDDSAAAVVQAIDTLHVALVDGDPSSEPLMGEVDFLALAFSLGATDADSFHVEVIPDGQWDWLSTRGRISIVLAECRQPDAGPRRSADQTGRVGRRLDDFSGRPGRSGQLQPGALPRRKRLAAGGDRKRRGPGAVGPGAGWRADWPAGGAGRN